MRHHLSTAAQVETDPAFRVVSLDTLFAIPEDVTLQFFANFCDVSSDGRRFLMGRLWEAGEAGTEGRYVLVQNFFEELRRLAPN